MADRRRTSYRGGNAHSPVNGKRKTEYRHHDYLDGSAVRAPQEIPIRKKQQPPKMVRKPTSRMVRKNREKALRMGLGYVMFLAIAAGILLFSCAKYIRIQTDISNRRRYISNLESELRELKISNDDHYDLLMSSVDLNSIREIATKELGMEYAKDSQIITFSSEGEDYVRQYKDVPEDKTISE
ncbi:MAG TPA: hypothetical protein IAC41_11140 [Candidatus Merdenecus merdavium]|nr:hypothetical protein [Candidatus Merdenecus merdavium]